MSPRSGIGKLTVKMLAEQGHTVLLHERTPAKLEAVVAETGAGTERYVADLSRMRDVEVMAAQVRAP
jgi:NAD(P)-dependent dehydrogenase (short-subunit alcohol dehydrogenase family)